MLSTKHVVLGLVIERRGYGYDLQQRVDNRFAFLGLSERMIYRTIDRLRKDGLIERVGAKGAGKTERGSPRVIYGPTQRGEEEFDRWMTAPCDLGVAREEVHVKVVLSQAPHLPRLVERPRRWREPAWRRCASCRKPRRRPSSSLSIPSFRGRRSRRCSSTMRSARACRG